MSMFKKVMMAFLVAMSATLAACDSNDGPVEKAGAKVDEGIEAITPEQGPMEEMGENMDDAYESTKEVFTE